MSNSRLRKLGARLAAVIGLVTSVATLITECTRRPYVHKSLTAEEIAADIKIDDSTRKWLQSNAHVLRTETPLELTDHKKVMEDWQKRTASVRATTPPPAQKEPTPEPALER